MTSVLPQNESQHLKELDIALRERLDSLKGVFAPTLASNAPASLLQAIAWGYDIDISAMSEYEARDALSSPFAFKSKVGTMGAVKRVVHNFDSDAIVEDIFNMNCLRLDGTCALDGTYRYVPLDFSAWNQYKITLTHTLSPTKGEALKTILNDVAPARSELVGYTYVPSLAWDGICKLDGTLSYGGFINGN